MLQPAPHLPIIREYLSKLRTDLLNECGMSADYSLSCDACMHRPANVVLWPGVRAQFVNSYKYYLCTNCRYDKVKPNRPKVNGTNASIYEQPSVQQHTANMKQHGHINMVKIAIGKIVHMTTASNDIFARCVSCIVNLVAYGDRGEICADLCRGCNRAMCMMSEQIRSAIATWIAGIPLPHDCNMVIIGKYVQVLLGQ